MRAINDPRIHLPYQRLGTSEIPEGLKTDEMEFTKDTLEGDYKGFRREIWTRSAYEKPNQTVGAAMIYFALIGENSAIDAGIFTDFFLPESVERWEESGVDSLRPHGMGGIVDFHWGFEIENLEPRNDCVLVPGKCWSLNTFTLGEQIAEAFARQGFEGIWHDLHEMLIDQTKVQLESE